GGRNGGRNGGRGGGWDEGFYGGMGDRAQANRGQEHDVDLEAALEESMEGFIDMDEEERRFLMDRQQREGIGYDWTDDYRLPDGDEEGGDLGTQEGNLGPRIRRTVGSDEEIDEIAFDPRRGRGQGGQGPGQGPGQSVGIGYKNLIGKFRNSGFGAQKFMHQMVFDEDTSVNIIENDCVCNAWNTIEYRF
ncbi:hypothetical protein B484DRAFT_452761, partial [Ochromonadaceae sp. CCMP2298]